MPKKQADDSEDPDPTPYLFVSLEQKRIDQTKPYDAKKSCWVPDEKEGFVLGEIRGTKGDLVTVAVPGGEVKKIQNASFKSIRGQLNTIYVLKAPMAKFLTLVKFLGSKQKNAIWWNYKLALHFKIIINKNTKLLFL